MPLHSTQLRKVSPRNKREDHYAHNSTLRAGKGFHKKRKYSFNRPGKRLAIQSSKAKHNRPARAACCAEVRQRAAGLCEARVDSGCAIAGEHVHEIRSRAQGGSITDPANCKYVCDHCHRWIHTHPRESSDRGLLHSKKWSAAA
jgi:uncharacterized protein YlaI